MHNKVYFINGINTTKHEARLASKELSNLTGEYVTNIYNPTYGVVLDSMETIRDRAFSWITPSNISKKIHKELSAMLYSNPELQLTVVAHSQGTQNAVTAVRMLPLEHRKRCHLVLFAPVNSFVPQGCGTFERWRNSGDWVKKYITRAGDGFYSVFGRLANLFRKQKLDKGQIFVRYNANEHSFISGYLDHLTEFDNYYHSYLLEIANNG